MITEKHIKNGLSSSVADGHVSQAQRDSGLSVKPVFIQNKLLEVTFPTDYSPSLCCPGKNREKLPLIRMQQVFLLSCLLKGLTDSESLWKAHNQILIKLHILFLYKLLLQRIFPDCISLDVIFSWNFFFNWWNFEAMPHNPREHLGKWHLLYLWLDF